MEKLVRLVRLVNLLTHRKGVDLATIMKTCDVPRRTAFRYLNVVSEAGIPVYFDKHARQYRVNNAYSATIANLSQQELLYILLGLNILSTRVDDNYQDDLKNLVMKLCERQPIEIEKLTADAELEKELSEFLTNGSAWLTSKIIDFAVTLNQPLRVQVLDDSGARQEFDIELPVMEFDYEWMISSAKDSTEHPPIPLSKVQRVSTRNNRSQR